MKTKNRFTRPRLSSLWEKWTMSQDRGLLASEVHLLTNVAQALLPSVDVIRELRLVGSVKWARLERQSVKEASGPLRDYVKLGQMLGHIHN